MSSAPTPSRRLTLAITAAVASTTLAIGVTAATLLGWFTPAPTPADPVAAVGAPPPAVILVPIAPTATPAVQVASDERPRRRDDDDHHGEHHAQEREDDDE